jgi:hypothetical protein
MGRCYLRPMLAGFKDVMIVRLNLLCNVLDRLAPLVPGFIVMYLPVSLDTACQNWFDKQSSLY